jgi:hypothetical protein
VINNVKVFMVACCQRSEAAGKCQTNQENDGYKVRFGETPKPARGARARSPEIRAGNVSA